MYIPDEENLRVRVAHDLIEEKRHKINELEKKKQLVYEKAIKVKLKDEIRFGLMHEGDTEKRNKEIDELDEKELNPIEKEIKELTAEVNLLVSHYGVSENS